MDEFPELFYLRNCPGANQEAGFFQIRPEISETSRPHPAPGVPGWPIPALAALFLCYAWALNYKLTGSVARTGGNPDFRESNYGGQYPPYSFL
jgi:hypothetical protein